VYVFRPWAVSAGSPFGPRSMWPRFFNSCQTSDGKSDKKVVLIDGEQLCRLMMDHKIGVTVRQTYEIMDGIYNLEMFETSLNAVTLMRRIEIISNISKRR
jgi:hypothetical protein